MSGVIHPRLRRLLDEDELDWDDPKHRETYLKTWVNAGSKAFREEEDEDANE